MPFLAAILTILLLLTLAFSLQSWVAYKQHPITRFKAIISGGGKAHKTELQSGFVIDKDREEEQIPKWISIKTHTPKLMHEVARHFSKCTCLVNMPTKKRLSNHYTFSWNILKSVAETAKACGCEVVDANFIYIAPYTKTEVYGHKMDGVADYELCVYNGSRGDARPYIQCANNQFYALDGERQLVFKPQEDRTYVNQTANPTILLRISFTESKSEDLASRDPIRSLLYHLFGV